MNQINQGFPDGYQFNRNVKVTSDGARIQEKQQQTLNEIYKALPTNLIKGSPLNYGEDGLPVIEDDPLQQQYETNLLEQQIQNSVYPPQRQQQQQGQQQQQVDPNTFFTAPSVRQKQGNQTQAQPQQNVQQNVPQRQPQPQQQQPSEGSTAYHPVVKKLLNVFGLRKNLRYDLEVYNENTGDKVVYKMTLISEELQSWAMAEGKQRMMLEPEVGAIYFELLFACCSVIGIDDIPLWEIFNIQLQDDEQKLVAGDRYEMSLRVRKMASRYLANILWSDTIPIGDKLLDFYQQKVVGKKVQSSLDREIDEKIRYVCPLDDCDNYEFFKPVLEQGVEKKFFCKYHGVEMVKTIDLRKELDLPLA